MVPVFGVSVPFASVSTAKTIANIIAAATKGLSVVKWSISLNGGSGAAATAPVLVEICKSTQGTAGTSTPQTPDVLRGRGAGVAALETVGTLYTVEPTILTPFGEAYEITPAGGLFVMQEPLDDEIESDTSTGTIKAIAFRITPQASIGGVLNIRWK